MSWLAQAGSTAAGAQGGMQGAAMGVPDKMAGQLLGTAQNLGQTAGALQEEMQRNLPRTQIQPFATSAPATGVMQSSAPIGQLNNNFSDLYRQYRGY